MSIAADGSAASFPSIWADSRNSRVAPTTPNIDSLQIADFQIVWGVQYVIDGNGTLYFLDDDYIMAMDSEGGKLWSIWIQWLHGMCLSPDGTICLTRVSAISSLNPDGTWRWNTTIDNSRTWAAPTISLNGTIYCALNSGLAALDENGTLIWEFHTSSPPAHIAIADDGALVFTTYNYSQRYGEVYSIFPNGTLNWDADFDGAYYPFVALAKDGRIFLKVNSTRLVALDSDGHELWSQSDLYWPPPAIGNDSLIFASGNKLVCLDLNGNFRWEYQAGMMVRDFLMTDDGTILFVTGVSIVLLDRNGGLIKSQQIIYPEEEQGEWSGLFYPEVGANGEIFVLYQFGGVITYIIKLGKAPERPDISAMDLQFSTYFVISIALASLLSILLFFRLLRSRGKVGKKETKAPRYKLLWTSAFIRVAGALFGLMAAGLVWRYQGLAQTGYFIAEPNTYLVGFHGWVFLSQFDSYAVLLFCLACVASLFTWVASYVALFSLLIYYNDLLFDYPHGSLIFQSDLSRGLPFGDGFLFAWLAVAIVLFSGLIAMFSEGKLAFHWHIADTSPKRD